MSPKVPGYLKHKATGKAICVIHGKTVYLVKCGNKANCKECDRVIAKYLANDRKPIPGRPRDVLTTEEAAVFF